MGYDASCQMFAGTDVSNIVERVVETKTIEVKDEWTDKVKGTKTVKREFYRYNGEDFHDGYDIEQKLKEKGLSIFIVGCEDSFMDGYVGIGKSTSYKNKVIKYTIEDLQDIVEKTKSVLADLGYIGDVEVYSTLYESY